MSDTKILFIDRDGTLIEEPADQQVDSLEKLQLEPGVIPALLTLHKQGYRLVMVTNQDGLGRPGYPQQAFDRVQDKLLQILESQGIFFEAILICPHVAKDACACRKPKPGLVSDYLARTDWDRTRSHVIGDRVTDCALAENMRIRGILYDRTRMGWSRIVSQLRDAPRSAALRRQTRETTIEVAVDLDTPSDMQIETGIGFFDHMLEQLACHAGISLTIRATGDLHIDEHHLVEDTALTLGQTLYQAFGDKYGIARYGFLLPMDEATTEVALDLGGRPWFDFQGRFTREKVGGLPTELVPHFFRSLAERLRATLHIKTRGENDHHQIESIFKAVGRTLRQAKTVEGHGLPSTKGVL